MVILAECRADDAGLTERQLVMLEEEIQRGTQWWPRRRL